MITRVAIENVTPLWPQVEPLVVSALRGRPTHDAEDVRKMLLAQLCNLWVQWSDHVEAMLVTEFNSFPKGTAVRVWLGAVSEGDEFDTDEFVAATKDWAKEHRCKWLLCEGRHGWLKRVPGAIPEGIMMRMDV